MAKEKTGLVEEVASKQTALDNALQQQGDSDKELAGAKERLQASLASKDETAQVSLYPSNMFDSAILPAIQGIMQTLDLLCFTKHEIQCRI